MALNPNMSDTEYETSLHRAVASGTRQEITEELKKHGNYVNVADSKGMIPLHRAILNERSVEVVAELLKYGSSVNALTKIGNSPLHLATRCRGNAGYVTELLAHAADVNISNLEGVTPLYQIVYCHCWKTKDTIEQLLKHGADVNIAHCRGSTPLHQAIHGEKDILLIKDLLKRGARVNVTDEYGSTPLHLASGCYKVEGYVAELLKYGACVKVVDHRGFSPLHEALSCRRDMDIIQQLLSHGALVNLADHEGLTPLHYAICEYMLDLKRAKEQLKKGIYVKVTDNAIHPLNLATDSGRALSYVKKLLEQGADPNVADCAGMTPLHEALYCNGSQDIVKQLLTFGADPNIADCDGVTPLKEAIFFKRNMVIVIDLLKHGAVSDWDSEKCNKLLRKVIDNVDCSKLLIKYTLLRTFREDCTNLFDLKPYEQLWSYDILLRHLGDCVSEIIGMQTTDIRDGLSLYTFVTTRNANIPLYCDCKSTQVNMQEEKIMTNYPLYSDIILPKVRYAFRRGILLSKLSKVRIYSKNHCCGLNESLQEGVTLNHDAILIITKFLSNVDLLHFIQASCTNDLDKCKSHSMCNVS